MDRHTAQTKNKEGGEKTKNKIERGKQSTCHVFGQTHCERKRDKKPKREARERKRGKSGRKRGLGNAKQ